MKTFAIAAGLVAASMVVGLAGCAPQSGNEPVAELNLPRVQPSVESAEVVDPLVPVEPVESANPKASPSRSATARPNPSPVKSSHSAPTVNPELGVGHNSGVGDDECFHDCGESTPEPSLDRGLEFAALEMHWDNLGAGGQIALCQTVRSGGISQWKAETGNRLSVDDLTWWLTTQCEGSRI